ncbi:MAG TPA: acyl-CoA reductase [Longimicrobiaceae bacterium]|jgi:hypothetical protein|nr:acyl-CoA reductase [Longimicrobiaceae bacterium]
MIDAFHLPAISPVPTTTWPYGRGGDALSIRVPRLSPALLRRQVEALVDARGRHLANRPVERIVASIDRVARRFEDAGDELRQTAERALPLVTGYSAPMIRRVLDRMAADWRAQPLRALLAAELGDAGALDGFVARAGVPSAARAYGPRLSTHVFSGNVPGVAVTSMIRTLLLKSATLGKTAVGEPVLAALFARALAEEDADLGECVAVTYWPGGDEEMERAALEIADAVIVYGGADAVASIRGRTPAGAKFLGYGHRISFGMVGREMLSGDAAREAAAACALDASTFDQQGCVSPHLFYAEEGGGVSPREWARMLAAEMEATERELPRGILAPREASAIRQLRGEAEFAQFAGGATEVHASAEGTAWTVVYDEDPAFAASCLNRVVRVKPVADLAEVAAHVAPFGSVLQSVGLAASPERTRTLAGELGRLGASRVVPLGRMAWPPPHWHHDGRPPLADLVRWCDLEK